MSLKQLRNVLAAGGDARPARTEQQGFEDRGGIRFQPPP